MKDAETQKASASPFEGLLEATGTEREAKLDEGSKALREELEQLSGKIVEVVLLQPPTGLLGYIWGQVFLGVVQDKRKGAKATRDFESYQFVLEYLHAVWSGNAGPYPAAGTALDEAKVEPLLSLFEEFRTKTLQYCLMSSLGERDTSLGKEFAELAFQAKSTWVVIRGHRHQVLEQEFFDFVLRPHDEALKAVYGIGASEVAAGMQRIADAFRAGMARAGALLKDRQQQAATRAETKSISVEAATDELKSEGPNFLEDVQSAVMDLFHGGVCNVSKHSKLPNALLEDMGYEPGVEQKFFEAGPFAGTPLRTLPARIRPLVRLGDDYYATDGQFVRDTAYRAIQRGLIGRDNSYRELWNLRQKELTEKAFPVLLSAQLQGATLLHEIYFQDAAGQWVETDTLGWLDDCLFVVEAKAGVMAMHSPEIDFERHIRAVQDLVVKAYRQCRRFVDYLASATEVPLFQLKDGKYSEFARLRLDDFRQILPIGLTIEAFTPFSAMCKRLGEVQPLLGKHPFISMSVDDLFVLNRFLPTAGALIHYLSVRQAVAGMNDASMFDELDHLGAYVQRNRFDRDMREQLQKSDWITWDGFSETVSDYFKLPDWESKKPPQQNFPSELSEVLEVLDLVRPTRWLKFDNFLRDLSGASRENFASVVRNLLPTLAQHPIRSFAFDGEVPFQIFLHRSNSAVPENDLIHHGEVVSLISRKPKVAVFTLGYDDSGKLVEIHCRDVQSPPLVRADYSALMAEADKKRANFIKLGHGGPKPSERLSKRARRRKRGKGA